MDDSTDRPPRRPPLPVVLVAGFLGAGKTTLVNHLLARADGRRLAVVVNDFGRVGIDPLLVTGGAESIEVSTGGCLCCVADDDDLPALFSRLAAPGAQVDAVVLEASGLADPGALARRVAVHPDVEPAALVHVVDATQALDTLAQHPSLARHVAAADVVVLNKVDAATDLDAVRAACRALNPTAPLVPTVEAAVDPRLVLDPAPRRPGPEQPLLALAADGYLERPHDGEHEAHVHEAYESVELVTASRIHPGRLAALLDDRPPGLFRLKGVVRLATSPTEAEAFVVQAVGRQVRFAPAQQVPDGVSRLVAIGAGMDVARVRAALDACAVPDDAPVDPGDLAAVRARVVGPLMLRGT